MSEDMEPEDIMAACARLREDEAITGPDCSESPYWSKESGYVYQLRDSDERTLARAFLAEHPADDEDKLIDNDFCRDSGFEPDRWVSGTVDWNVPCDHLRITVRVWDHERPDLILENIGEVGNVQLELSTRGQLRMLLKALGVRQ